MPSGLMMIRTGLSGISVCFLITVVCGAHSQSGPSATDEAGGFAVPDQGGTRLLLMQTLMHPELLKTALCSGGRRFRVRFERRQEERAGHNGRQTADNFDNLAGNVYRMLGGRADPDATCFLASEPLLAGTTLLNIAAPVGSGACVQGERFATLRDRPVTHCWTIARLGPGKDVALLEFARRGKDALASLVVVDGARTMFADYPAEFRREGEDLWRADDGGVLSPEGFQLICAFRRGSWYALGVAWSGSEGRSLSLWIADESERFTKTLADYWYQLPT